MASTAGLRPKLKTAALLGLAVLCPPMAAWATPQTSPDLIQAGLPLLSVIAGGLVTWGVMRTKIQTHERDLAKLQHWVAEVDKRQRELDGASQRVLGRLEEVARNFVTLLEGQREIREELHQMRMEDRKR